MLDLELIGAAGRLRDQLATKQLRIVLAESCTAGQVASSLALLPGISAWLCGSLVVYRNESKAQWLGIDRTLLDDPQVGPVSSLVTEQLAQAALAKTPEAQLGLAVTGHVGPGVDNPELDGVVFCALSRCDATVRIQQASTRLRSPAPRDQTSIAERTARLREATLWVIQTATLWLEQETHPPVN